MARTTLKIKNPKAMVDCTCNERKAGCGMWLCDYCIQAIESHGERLKRVRTEESANPFLNLVCDFCGDDCESLTLCR